MFAHPPFETAHTHHQESQVLAIDIKDLPPGALGHLGAEVLGGVVYGGDGELVGLVRQVQALGAEQGRVEVLDDAAGDGGAREREEVEGLEVGHGQRVRQRHVRVERQEGEDARLGGEDPVVAVRVGRLGEVVG